MNIASLCERLCGRDGITGREASLDLREELASFGAVRQTPVGSLICEVPGEGVPILLDAHADRIGLIVTEITPEGFLRFDKVGGMDRRVLCASAVTVRGRRDVPGVITSVPPHLMKDGDGDKAPQFDELFVDVGMTQEEARAVISVGDAVTVDGSPRFLSDSRLTGAALDDRAGVAALLGTLDILRENGCGRAVTVMLSAQEETGGPGAGTGAFAVQPAEAIAVDVSFAVQDGVALHQAGKLGAGPMICFSPSLSREMSRRLVNTAERNGIPYQLEVASGSTGTNADDIAGSGCGVVTGLVSIPQRNMHTQAELVDVEDVKAVALLLAAYIMGED